MSDHKKEWLFRISDMLNAIQDAHEFTEDITYETFEEDRKTYLAVLHSVMIIGEACKYIPLEVLEQYPQIPWRDVKSMRNKITHDYTGVRPEVVWNVAREELLELEICLKKIYSDFQ